MTAQPRLTTAQLQELQASLPGTQVILGPPGGAGSAFLLAVCRHSHYMEAVTRACRRWQSELPPEAPLASVRAVLEQDFLREAADARSEAGQAARHGTAADCQPADCPEIPDPDPEDVKHRTLLLCHQASGLAAMNALAGTGVIAPDQPREAATAHRALHLAFTALLTSENDPWPEDPDPLHAWHHFRTNNPLPQTPELEALKDLLALTASANGQDCVLGRPLEKPLSPAAWEACLHKLEDAVAAVVNEALSRAELSRAHLHALSTDRHTRLQVTPA